MQRREQSRVIGDRRRGVASKPRHPPPPTRVWRAIAKLCGVGGRRWCRRAELGRRVEGLVGCWSRPEKSWKWSAGNRHCIGVYNPGPGIVDGAPWWQGKVLLLATTTLLSTAFVGAVAAATATTTTAPVALVLLLLLARRHRRRRPGREGAVGGAVGWAIATRTSGCWRHRRARLRRQRGSVAPGGRC